MFQLIYRDLESGKTGGVPGLLWKTFPGACCELDTHFPLADVVKTEKGWDFLVELPGMDARNIKIAVNGEHLEITADTVSETEKNVYRERFSGSQKRRFRLPTSADTESISADLDKGILTVHVLQKSESAARQIPIKTS